MHEVLEKLIRLDQIDTEIARLKAEVADLPKRVAEIEARLAADKAQVESAQSALKNNDKRKRDLEGEIKELEQKISKYKDQSLSVKTNDQYKALMHEIDFAQKQIGGCEEKILFGMEEADTLQKQLKTAEADLKVQVVANQKEKEHAHAVTAEDQKKLAELSSEREAISPQIDSTTLAHYSRVRSKRTGSAMAEAFEQKCLACHVMMRPQRYNDVLTGADMVMCESCSRILYVDQAHLAQKNAPAEAVTS